MKLTSWLGNASPLDILPPGELHELRWWDIRFHDQSMQLEGNGILVPAPVMNDQAVLDLARRDGWVLDSLPNGLWVVLYKLTDALVQILLPMRPTSIVRSPTERNRILLDDLRHAGF